MQTYFMLVSQAMQKVPESSEIQLEIILRYQTIYLAFSRGKSALLDSIYDWLFIFFELTKFIIHFVICDDFDISLAEIITSQADK